MQRNLWEVGLAVSIFPKISYPKPSLAFESLTRAVPPIILVKGKSLSRGKEFSDRATEMKTFLRRYANPNYGMAWPVRNPCLASVHGIIRDPDNSTKRDVLPGREVLRLWVHRGKVY